MCSAIGGTVSCIIMMIATAPIADWAISAFGPPEIFALVFFGLAVASSVGAKTFWKGWLSILIGLMIAVVGLDYRLHDGRCNGGFIIATKICSHLGSKKYGF